MKPSTCKRIVLLLVCGLIGCAQAAPPVVFNATADADPMPPFKCEMALVIEGQKIVCKLCFYGPYALEYDPTDPRHVVAIYDLKQQKWTDLETGKTVTRQAAERWAAGTIIKTRESLANMEDGGAKRFIELSLAPELLLEGDDQRLVLQNEVLTYRLTRPLQLEPLQKQRFFAYDLLNAYRKAMTDRKLAPFPQLAVNDAMALRGFVPGHVEVDVRVQDKVMPTKFDLQVVNLTPAEVAQVRADLQAKQ